jgi:hypothetical protein
VSTKEARMPQMPAPDERPRLRPVEGGAGRAGRKPSRVVAVVLSDGSVRDLHAGWGEAGDDDRSWASGSLAGEGWVLWWERRAFRG